MSIVSQGRGALYIDRGPLLRARGLDSFRFPIRPIRDWTPPRFWRKERVTWYRKACHPLTRLNDDAVDFRDGAFRVCLFACWIGGLGTSFGEIDKLV